MLHRFAVKVFFFLQSKQISTLRIYFISFSCQQIISRHKFQFKQITVRTNLSANCWKKLRRNEKSSYNVWTFEEKANDMLLIVSPWINIRRRLSSIELLLEITKTVKRRDGREESKRSSRMRVKKHFDFWRYVWLKHNKDSDFPIENT